MKLRSCAFGLALVASAQAANATTVVIFTDPMTLARHTVVYNTPGPMRVFMCMAPPSEAGCTAVRFRTSR